MGKFKVTIARTLLTEITVDAASAADARRAVESYGVDLAAADYPGHDINASSRIKSVRTAEAA